MVVDSVGLAVDSEVVHSVGDLVEVNSAAAAWAVASSEVEVSAVASSEEEVSAVADTAAAHNHSS